MPETQQTPTTSNASDVRTWAQANGHDVKSTGRFSGDLLAAFNTAHPDAPYQR